MQIVINHLTRMTSGFCCVAGVDLDSRRHVRPVVPGQRLRVGLLSPNGGPFDVGSIVDLSTVTPCGQAPELEDHQFRPASARFVQQARYEALWEFMEGVASPDIESIFGEDLQHVGSRSYGVEPGHGTVSLGILKPQGRVSLHIKHRPGKHAQIRASWQGRRSACDVGITDIRLYDWRTDYAPHLDRVKRLNARLESGDEAILCVGLTRAFASSPDFSPVHWLQANNIYPKSVGNWYYRLQ